MTGKWTEHYKGQVSGRPVRVSSYSAGGYRVETNQGIEDPARVSSDSTSITISPTYGPDTMIEIDGNSIREVGTQLLEVGFNDDEINQILERFKNA